MLREGKNRESQTQNQKERELGDSVKKKKRKDGTSVLKRREKSVGLTEFSGEH